MVKTLKNYILKGGIKGQFFEFKDSFYEVEGKILVIDSIPYMEVILQKKVDTYPRIQKLSLNMTDHLDDKEYKPWRLKKGFART